MSFLDLSYSIIGPASVVLLSHVPPPPPLERPPGQPVIVQEVYLEKSLRDGVSDASQSYYWTREWQEAEHEAMEELRRGEYVSFSSGADAARWLKGD